MEDLFRFMLARPAQSIDSRGGSIPLQPSSEFHKGLKTARESKDPLTAVRQAAAAHAYSAASLHSVDDLKYGTQLSWFWESISGGPDKSISELTALVKKGFAATPSEVLSDAGFQKDREQLGDTLITNAILGREPSVSSDEAARLLRSAAIVARVAANDADLAAKGGVARAMKATITLPSDLFPLPRVPQSRQATPIKSPSPDLDRRGAVLKRERDRLLSTYTMLTHVTPDHIETPEATSSYSVGMELASASSEPATAYKAATALLPMAPIEATPTATEEPHRRILRAPGLGVRLTGAPLVLKSAVAAAIGEREQAVLQERQLDLTQTSLPTVVDRLSMELQDLELELTAIESTTHKAIARIGQGYVDSATMAVGDFVIGGLANAAFAVPTTHGSVAPAGIGDLLVVKQSLKRYEGRELSHVENVLKGEYKERMHRRALTTEETITTETEVKREEERDQQTTERFELKTESSQIQKEDTSLKIGLAISGKYGPIVEFKASTDFALNTSKEEASKIATSYSKDITTRATSRISERRREERILKTIEVFEEKNTHGIDNKAGDGHVIGQYQWIDKIYEAQVYNYGKRLLFDIMLPEPAAFLLYGSAGQPKAGAELVKPLLFTLKPTDVSEWNYAYYVMQYEVLGVNAPPQPYSTVSKAFEGKGSGDDDVTKAAEIPLPDGYQAISGFVSAWYNRTSGGVVDVALGNQMHRFSDNGGWNVTLGNEVGSVEFSMKTWHASELAIGVEIQCQRTQRALDDWKLKTHAAILQAYQKQLRDYEEKLAALEVLAEQQIQGRNPAENEQLIRTELKKGAISVFTGQHYDLFGAISSSSQGYPQPDIAEADTEGRYIRFFEQAFEWEQMMYFFYPYFWGRKSNWLRRALLQDVDSLFAEFIKAGSARAVISVRPGFEKAIAHFLDTGAIWDGGDLPDITSPLYVSIIDEIRERDEAPDREVPQGDPWDVRLPTTLVILRDEPELPAWHKNAQGEWVPV